MTKQVTSEIAKGLNPFYKLSPFLVLKYYGKAFEKSLFLFGPNVNQTKKKVFQRSPYFFLLFATLAHESLKETVLLNTSEPGMESFESTQK